MVEMISFEFPKHFLLHLEKYEAKEKQNLGVLQASPVSYEGFPKSEGSNPMRAISNFMKQKNSKKSMRHTGFLVYGVM